MANNENPVNAIRNGDSKAFERLYENYFQKVFFFALKICKHREAAEEITHDTFVTIWRKRDTLREDIPIDGLIFKITRDGAFKYLQKVARDVTFEANLAATTPNFDNGTADEIAYREKLEQLDEAINELPPKRKAIYEKKVLEQQSIKDISADMGISENTTKTQLQKATQFVRERLANFL